VLGSIERLKRKWFRPAEIFGVFQQYRSLSASGDRILSVCFGEITPDCYRQIKSLKNFPPKPENFSKADSENSKPRGNLRPTAAVRLSLQEGSNRHITVVDKESNE
jgi:hypothetical protein